jgi:hypothetical protein
MPKKKWGDLSTSGSWGSSEGSETRIFPSEGGGGLESRCSTRVSVSLNELAAMIRRHSVMDNDSRVCYLEGWWLSIAYITPRFIGLGVLCVGLRQLGTGAGSPVESRTPDLWSAHVLGGNQWVRSTSWNIWAQRACWQWAKLDEYENINEINSAYHIEGTSVIYKGRWYWALRPSCMGILHFGNNYGPQASFSLFCVVVGYFLLRPACY